MTDKEKQNYMEYCKYDKEPKEVILQLIEIIEEKQDKLKSKDKEIKCLKCMHNKLVTEIVAKDEIMKKSIEKIEELRQDFSEDCQVEFINILEILKNKKAIDW